MVSPTFTLVLIALRESVIPQSSWSGISATENLMRTPPVLWNRSSTSDTALAADSRTTTTASADGETQYRPVMQSNHHQCNHTSAPTTSCVLLTVPWIHAGVLPKDMRLHSLSQTCSLPAISMSTGIIALNCLAVPSIQKIEEQVLVKV